ncbi:hypothetical protein [Terasakiella pusilla]|uniref:hypothetical protein n=1 Tax=Terasakiella pusilla TaxID=64973 RepID=UPI003AA85542
MSDPRKTAFELYKEHGLKNASFIAFHKMQITNQEHDASFWLSVVNQLTLLDVMGDDTALAPTQNTGE